MIQGTLAVIRVAVWVWDPLWDNFLTKTESPRSLSGKRMLNYDLTETRLVVLWASLQMEYPEWLSNSKYPKYLSDSNVSDPSISTPLIIPKWALPAFRPRNQDPERMFELARKLRRDNIEWDESFRVLQNAEDFWDMPRELFMAWVFAWPKSDSSWVDGYVKTFSCRIIKDKQYENGVQRFHFLPCFYDKSVHPGPKGDDRKSFALRVFGVPYNRNRCVFAFDENPNMYTKSGGPLQHELVVGLDTPISVYNSRRPADILGEFSVETIFGTMDRMWKALDPILKYPPRRPSSPAAPTEPHTPTTSVSTAQQASPARSVASAPLPGAAEETQSDADIIRPQPRRRTN